MSIFSLLVIALGLSADAFAVSVCQGVFMKNIDIKKALTVALFFGVFQAFMPIMGWGCGSVFAEAIKKYDAFIAFGLLSFIGVKMIVDSINGKEDKDEIKKIGGIKQILILAVATSIDALAAGISFAALSVAIIPAAMFIGFVTFTLCLIGVYIGMRFGAKFKTSAKVLGGCALVMIGIKILIEHLSS